MNRSVYEAAIDHFDVPREATVADLRAFTHGPKPTAVDAALKAFANEWRDSGVDAWNRLKFPEPFKGTSEDGHLGWWQMPEVLGDRFVAPVLGAARGTCIMMPNATTVVTALLSCPELHQPGRRSVVTTDGEFSAVQHPLSNYNRTFSGYPAAVRKAIEFQTHHVPTVQDGFSAEAVMEQIGDKTALVVVSHVGFLTGERIPDEEVRAIVDRAHQYGALVAVDGYHAIGSPIDVQATGTDIYFGGLLKEGCGSSGNGFLYVRPGLELHPATGGWFGAAAPFAFRKDYEAAPAVRRRFLSGTPAIASLYHGIQGLRVMQNIGYTEVVRDIGEKVDALVSGLQQGGAELVSPVDPSRRSALVVARVPQADKFRDHLAEEGVLVDARLNQVVRMAPHIFVSPEQIEHAVREIVKGLQSKTYLNRPDDVRGGPVT